MSKLEVITTHFDDKSYGYWVGDEFFEKEEDAKAYLNKLKFNSVCFKEAQS